MAKHARPSNGDTLGAIASNSRLTSSLGVVLLLTLFLEGLTIPIVGAHLSWHVFLGTVLIPVVVLKVGSTFWRFYRYYLGDPAYVEKGPPPILLRLLGPFVVVLSLEVLLSGLFLIVIAPSSIRNLMLLAHKAGFVLWFGAMIIHVLGHLAETLREGTLDYRRYTRQSVARASLRQWLLAGSLAVGVLLAVWVTPYSNSFFAHGFIPSR
jgi:hypothetical protein